ASTCCLTGRSRRVPAPSEPCSVPSACSRFGRCQGDRPTQARLCETGQPVGGRLRQERQRIPCRGRQSVTCPEAVEFRLPCEHRTPTHRCLQPLRKALNAIEGDICIGLTATTFLSASRTSAGSVSSRGTRLEITPRSARGPTSTEKC